MQYCVADDRGIGRTSEARPSADLAIGDAVGVGCPNRREDVLVVQSLLNVAYARVRVPRRTIPVDGLLGRDTQAAIVRFQEAQGATADGRIDPDGLTLERLNAVAAGPARTVASAKAATMLSPVEAALEASSTAKAWAAAARGYVEPLLGSGRSVTDRLATVNTHFHLDRDPASMLEALARLSEVLGDVRQILDAATAIFREGGPVAGSPLVEVALGALHADDPEARTIVFRPGFAACGPNTRAALILHACAHYVGEGDEIAHFALEFPAPEGAPHERGTHNYRELTPAEALRNAASYTAFAIHAATGTDQRFGARDPLL